MRFWKKRKDKQANSGSGSRKSKSAGAARSATRDHFARFIDTRIGVEAYVEPPTNVTGPTMVLIANTGEWTRRKVPSLEQGWSLARELDIPVYDVNQVGYPHRMREWNSKKRAEWQRDQKRN